jgi:hypothetical protein
VTVDAANTSTPEDTHVALGFNAPTVSDAIDQNGPGVSGDNPERLGLITLNGIPAGAQLLDGTNSNLVLHLAAGGAITILLSDATNLISSPGAATLTMTTAQFEALRVLPAANNGSNLSVSMSVTSFEVDNAGSQISGVAGAVSSTVVNIDVLAVTDTVDLKINGVQPYVEAARVYALAGGIAATNTPERLRAAGASRGIASADVAAWCEAFGTLQRLRLELNLRQIAAGRSADNHLDPRTLDAAAQRSLRTALNATRGLQARLARDFGAAVPAFGA